MHIHKSSFPHLHSNAVIFKAGVLCSLDLHRYPHDKQVEKKQCFLRPWHPHDKIEDILWSEVMNVKIYKNGKNVDFLIQKNCSLRMESWSAPNTELELRWGIVRIYQKFSAFFKIIFISKGIVRETDTQRKWHIDWQKDELTTHISLYKGNLTIGKTWIQMLKYFWKSSSTVGNPELQLLCLSSLKNWKSSMWSPLTHGQRWATHNI